MEIRGQGWTPPEAGRVWARSAVPNNNGPVIQGTGSTRRLRTPDASLTGGVSRRRAAVSSPGRARATVGAMAEMKRRPLRNVRAWLTVVVIAIVAAGFFLASRPQPSDAPSMSPSQTHTAGGVGGPAAGDEQALAVGVRPVALRSLTQWVNINANVAPTREVAVAPKISGTVKSVLVDVGDRVEAGQEVLRLEDEELTVQLQQAAAALELAEANLERLIAGATEEEREQAAAALRQAELNLDQAKRQLERMEQLFEEQAVSREQLDAARTAYGIAQAQYEAARQQALRLERGATPEELRAARAQVAQARAARELAELQLGYATVTAPFAGIVAQRNVEPGGLIAAGTPALAIVDIDRVYVRGSISQAHVNRVVVGEMVEVDVPSAGGSVTGVIHTVSPAVDQGGLFPLRVEVDNPDHRLKPGMFATVRIPLARAVNVPTVPIHSVVGRGDQRAVFVVEPDPSRPGYGTARLRRVELGVEEGEFVEIVRGVQEGEWVVTAGQAFLSDGRAVVWTAEE